jgi:non-lysosomal glucosylceramidase
LSVKKRLPPGTSVTITFSLSWDCPIVRFESGIAYYRWYTRFFNRKGDSAEKLAIHSLSHYQEWASLIINWQNSLLSNKNVPKGYRSALFNELSVLSSSSLWTDGKDDDTDQEKILRDLVCTITNIV